MLRAILLGVVFLLAACGSSGSTFGGTWSGTKTSLKSDGSVAATDSWTVSIQEAGAQSLLISGEVAATVDSASTFMVGRQPYAPAWPPYQLGHCVPTNATIVDGTGNLSSPDTLRMTLHWTYECGGGTTDAATVYDLQRVDGTVQPVRL